MEYGEKYLKYKGQVVFGKQALPYFDRMPKEYSEDEACFVFVNDGEVSVRSQNDYMDLNKKHGILAKCLNYFFEGDTVKASKPVHGKTSKLYHNSTGIYKDIPNKIDIARYHSLKIILGKNLENPLTRRERLFFLGNGYPSFGEEPLKQLPTDLR